MKVAFPSEENKGLDSLVHGHFGSAKGFFIVNLDTNAFEYIDNSDRDHEHGKCQPLAAVGNQSIDAVVVGGIGKGAVHGLNNAGIKVFRAVEGTIQENMELLKKGTLPEMTAQDACKGHHQGSGCSHHKC